MSQSRRTRPMTTKQANRAFRERSWCSFLCACRIVRSQAPCVVQRWMDARLAENTTSDLDVQALASTATRCYLEQQEPESVLDILLFEEVEAIFREAFCQARQQVMRRKVVRIRTLAETIDAANSQKAGQHNAEFSQLDTTFSVETASTDAPGVKDQEGRHLHV